MDLQHHLYGTTFITEHNGYIAGLGSGIASRAGEPSRLKILVYDSTTDQLIRRTESLPNGRYLIAYLDPNRRYRLVAIDPKRIYQAMVWDNIRPAQDLSIKELKVLWQEMTSAYKP